eukprot:365417-Chlamydomonas_euryale.AAC.15
MVCVGSGLDEWMDGHWWWRLRRASCARTCACRVPRRSWKRRAAVGMRCTRMTVPLVLALASSEPSWLQASASNGPLCAAASHRTLPPSNCRECQASGEGGAGGGWVGAEHCQHDAVEKFIGLMSCSVNSGNVEGRGWHSGRPFRVVTQTQEALVGPGAFFTHSCNPRRHLACHCCYSFDGTFGSCGRSMVHILLPCRHTYSRHARFPRMQCRTAAASPTGRKPAAHQSRRPLEVPAGLGYHTW